MVDQAIPVPLDFLFDLLLANKGEVADETGEFRQPDLNAVEQRAGRLGRGKFKRLTGMNVKEIAPQNMGEVAEVADILAKEINRGQSRREFGDIKTPGL
jgi:hypothetical protein